MSITFNHLSKSGVLQVIDSRHFIVNIDITQSICMLVLITPVNLIQLSKVWSIADLYDHL